MDRPPERTFFSALRRRASSSLPPPDRAPGQWTPKVCDLDTYKPDCFAQVMTYSQMIQDCLSDLSGSVGSVSLS